jgi:RNA polymerase sigma-70 factor, ECF subfamily
MDPTGEVDDLLVQLRAAAGDQAAWEEIVRSFGPRLRAMIQLRMHAQLKGRIDPSDVLQETYIDASRRLAEYLDHPAVPFYVWLRSLANQRLITLYRRHLGAKLRTAQRDISLYDEPYPEATSAALAARLVGQLTTPSSAALLAEMQLRLADALNELEAIDREILVLRHFEEMTNGEAAAVLGLSPSAACNRYVRALERMRQVLGNNFIDPSELQR